MSNEEILEQIYGWVDPIDYSQYKREEEKDSKGIVYQINYLDANNKKVGWQVDLETNLSIIHIISQMIQERELK